MRAAVLSAALLLVVGLPGCGEPSDASVDVNDPTARRTNRSESEPGIPNIATRAEVWTRALGTFLEKGPVEGTWSVQGPSLEWTWHFQRNPINASEVFAAQVKKDGTLESVASVSRLRTALFFYEAPGWLFMLNYRLHGAPRTVTMKDGRRAVRLRWHPVHTTDDLTERVAWFSESGAVLQIEDRNRTGETVRRVRRVVESTLEFDPDELEAKKDPCCPDVPDVAADDLDRLADAAFKIFKPAYVPPGYMIIRAHYEDAYLPDDGPRVERATLLYSDGVGIISFAIAPSDHMDAISRHYSTMPVRDGDADVCPGLPAEPQKLVRRAGVIRMRKGVCRTVLRLDGVDETLSVMVIGRNELPTEAYLRMIQNLERVEFDHVNMPDVKPVDDDKPKQGDAKGSK